MTNFESDLLQAQRAAFTVIGRSAASAEAFHQATWMPVVAGWLEAALAQMPTPEQAIVAEGVEQLAPVTQQLIAAGCGQLLLEKPRALQLAELEAMDAATQAHGASV